MNSHLCLTGAHDDRKMVFPASQAPYCGWKEQGSHCTIQITPAACVCTSQIFEHYVLQLLQLRASLACGPGNHHLQRDFFFFLSPSCTTHVCVCGFFFVQFQPRLCRFILLKIKTLFNALELDYCNDIELSTEICGDTILEKIFPLSAEHISCISKPARRLKYNY